MDCASRHRDAGGLRRADTRGPDAPGPGHVADVGRARQDERVDARRRHQDQATIAPLGDDQGRRIARAHRNGSSTRSPTLSHPVAVTTTTSSAR